MQLLTEVQRALLTAVGKSKLAPDVYFTGGTLLSFFYLKHRRSLDLDFFSNDLLDDIFVARTIKEMSTSVNAQDV